MEMRRAVRTEIREGADWIKVMTSHRSDVAEYTQEELNAAVDECHRHNRKAVAHSSRQPALQYCINAGFDTIEHGTDLTLEQILQMKEKGIAWTPTLYVYKSVCEKFTEKVAKNGIETLNYKELLLYNVFVPGHHYYREHFKEFADTGVEITAGTEHDIRRG